MSAALRDVLLIGLGFTFGIALTSTPAWPQTPGTPAATEKGAKKPVQTWAKVEVELPTSPTLFPAGNGADIANGQCLICHSAGMVLRQPPLTQDEWRSEVNKMRNAFGALLPADQVDALARYLYSIDGSRAPTDRAVSGGRAADTQ
jgi:mono/diheme cytochrome c family protein